MKVFTLMAFFIITLWILTPAQLPCLIKGDKVVTLWAIPALTVRIVCRRARAPHRGLSEFPSRHC